MDQAIAARSHGLMNGLIVNSELSSEMAFNEFNISITTKTLKERVLALTLPAVKY